MTTLHPTHLTGLHTSLPFISALFVSLHFASVPMLSSPILSSPLLTSHAFPSSHAFPCPLSHSPFLTSTSAQALRRGKAPLLRSQPFHHSILSALAERLEGEGGGEGEKNTWVAPPSTH